MPDAETILCPEVFKKAVDLCPDPVIIVEWKINKDPTIIYANEAFEETFEYFKEEYIGKHPKFIFHSSYSSIHIEIEEHLKRNKEWNGDVLTVSKNQQEFWHFIRVMWATQKGSTRYYAATYSNITGVKDIEEHLIELSKKLNI